LVGRVLWQDREMHVVSGDQSAADVMRRVGLGRFVGGRSSAGDGRDNEEGDNEGSEEGGSPAIGGGGEDASSEQASFEDLLLGFLEGDASE